MTSRLVVILLVIAATVVITVRAVPSWASTMTLDADQGNAFGWNHLRENEHITLGYDFWNRDRWPVVVRDVSLPVRTHLRIEGKGIIHGACRFFGEKSTRITRLTQDVNGYRVGTGEHICVAVFVTPRTPGKFLVGPVTLHADLPLPLGAIPVEVTSGFRTTLCVRQTC